MGQASSFERLFEKVFIAKSVFNEVTVIEKPFSERLKFFATDLIIKAENRIAVNILSKEIDLGEAETIIIALEKKLPCIILDDYKARKYAQLNGLKVIGTIGVLIKAKQIGKITNVKNELDVLIKNKIRISESLYNKALVLSNET
ncbi:MAG: DUF3368 domain-containing protein [Ignavibacteria bacterium CG_4_8_14_3_um_filter_37_9]|nr:MAG: DUF3368 domain-containing protein [Ignavibacteria bacterium CG08_land_8_20_14_0_20_37_9]PIW99943.1 MAG: DUF3368 domain-containing protein [Ignavibacteria bacterium CG_4_8_14_3_um_filter_37_9]PIX94789.1 MAG: DUF3368 domain-containing protein [Ignavibacteria bacterium CG_4_10_14_3_um_filter_37_18]PJC57039.1 MAG: DUF3368 domain-containing protein [Ignavibacteria bacterium CG_4_9_14_0_2_um_filter_37_13]